MSNNVSDERKALYYIGMGLVILGVILFFSGFFIEYNEFEPFFNTGMPPSFKRALMGMICMIIGSILMNVGAKGAAGSGIILDPDKAREDLKPYSSAAGGMINDVIENIDIVKGKNITNNKMETREIVKIKCRACGELNDEDANFCKSCGDKM